MIFTAIFPLGYPGCRCYVSAVAEGVKRFRYYGLVSPKSADHANWANSSARDCPRSGGLAWNGLIPSGGYMAGLGTSSLHDYFDYQARV